MSVPASVQQMNDHAVEVLENYLMRGSSAVPWQAQQAAREACVAYRNGDRDPELLMFLSTMFNAADVNLLRDKLVKASEQTALTLSMVL